MEVNIYINLRIFKGWTDGFFKNLGFIQRTQKTLWT